MAVVVFTVVVLCVFFIVDVSFGVLVVVVAVGVIRCCDGCCCWCCWCN